jgi:hypothetical protein
VTDPMAISVKICADAYRDLDPVVPKTNANNTGIIPVSVKILHTQPHANTPKYDTDPAPDLTCIPPLQLGSKQNLVPVHCSVIFKKF